MFYQLIMNQKASAGIFIILGILLVTFLAVAFYSGFFKIGNISKTAFPNPTPYNISADPKYEPVQEKYHLDQEQLQILSTVNQEDNN